MKKNSLSNIIQMASVSKIRKVLGTLVLALVCVSCDFLDIMPDNVVTIDHAFSNASEAEKYLFTCYRYLPRGGSPDQNIGMLAGDECWIPEERPRLNLNTWNIARGYQNKATPLANFWDGDMGGDIGQPMFRAIRECNTFLENIKDMTKVRDLPLDKRVRWISEAQFLKAYYHYYLLRMYGPIPICDKNIPVYATPEEVRVKRQPVDKCVAYISDLLDQSIENLPKIISRPNDEMGRVTVSVALSVKAKLLLLAASPLFNGNPDYANFKNVDGELLFNPTVESSKWEAAAMATKAAIDEAESAGAELYEFENNSPLKLSKESMQMMTIRNSICERWNKETIWGNMSSSAGAIQNYCMAILTEKTEVNTVNCQMAPPLKMVEMFYTKNGVPIQEDKTLDFTDTKQLRMATAEENVYIQKGYVTARLNFDREPRFYADLGFDGGTWLMYDTPSRTDEDTYVFKAKRGQIGAGSVFGCFSETGYLIKKLVHWESTYEEKSIVKEYPWPEIRLADLYLMYAEALNEVKSAPDADVYFYLDEVRKRAGLKGVVESWTNYSSNPLKVTSKVGMREIIQQERGIELAFEGSRFWDLRRWKTALKELNKPVLGWTISQPTAAAYYQPRVIFQQKFITPRDYLWPICTNELAVNFDLVQNPGW